MIGSTKSVLFLDCLAICSLLCLRIGNSQDPPLAVCPNNTLYDANSTTGRIYGGNLKFLLLSLTSNASTTPNGFYNFTVGSVDSANDPAIYGLFLCRGDLTTGACHECVATASTEILRRCTSVKTAGIWFQKCMLRYSNESIFSRPDNGVMWAVSAVDVVSNLTLWTQVLSGTMDQIENDAASGTSSGKKFSVKEANYTAFQKLYALGQCTPDLSSLDCRTCLAQVIGYVPSCCSSTTFARIIAPSCDIRYDINPFYDISASPEPTPNPPSPPSPSPPPSPSLPPPPPRRSPSTNGKSRRVEIAIALSIVSSVVLFIISFVFLKRRSIKKHPTKMPDAVDTDDITIDPESLQYSLSVIELATNKFSVDNKIGQGGFGSVYKGKLPNGQDIAVKRLSKGSSQGVREFKNEIGVVAKLQHKNLVRLLGFCLEGEEKILVFEFVPNRSLDYFLFDNCQDSDKKGLLDWSKRRNIIGGIARGLLYLHEDSRLKIVHRDLKAGNILLDEDMQPKIADFGMAKICRMDQFEGKTNKIAGTIGYMAPEYTRRGRYSIKSDVFSFGVVLLEIITGKKNSSFYQSEDSEDLLSYVWRHWRNDTPLAVVDQTIGDSYAQNEVIQNLHVGLLCVEEDANKRPTMASVVYMLNSTSISLPAPRRPATRWHHMSKNTEKDLGSDHANNKAPASVNIASITEPYPR